MRANVSGQRVREAHLFARACRKIVSSPHACLSCGCHPWFLRAGSGPQVLPLRDPPTVRAGSGPQDMQNPRAPHLRCHRCGNVANQLVEEGGAIAGASVCGLCLALEGLQLMANNVCFLEPAREYMTQALLDKVSDLGVRARRCGWQRPPAPEQYSLGLGLSERRVGGDLHPLLPKTYLNSDGCTTAQSIPD